MADTDNPRPQGEGQHGAGPNSEGTVPSIYAAMGVPSLQDQADLGGWLPHGMPVNGDAPSLMTMGTRGSFSPAPDNQDTKDN